jgi:hypothetical protein
MGWRRTEQHAHVTVGLNALNSLDLQSAFTVLCLQQMLCVARRYYAQLIHLASFSTEQSCWESKSLVVGQEIPFDTYGSNYSVLRHCV